MSRRLLPLLIILTLAGCGKEEKPDPRRDRDSAVSRALDDKLMTDPDLVGQSQADTALTGGGPATAEIPPDKRTPEEAEKARLAARDLFGGAEIAPVPAAAQNLPKSRLAGSITLEAGLSALRLAPADCVAKLAYSFAWAARLPAALPIYPRGHARVAGGVDEPGCKVRAVRFVTPVAVADVTGFYFASARRANLAPLHQSEGADEVISGKGFAVYARPAGEGLSEVELYTSGL